MPALCSTACLWQSPGMAMLQHLQHAGFMTPGLGPAGLVHNVLVAVKDDLQPAKFTTWSFDNVTRREFEHQLERMGVMGLIQIKDVEPESVHEAMRALARRRAPLVNLSSTTLCSNAAYLAVSRSSLEEVCCMSAL